MPTETFMFLQPHHDNYLHFVPGDSVHQWQQVTLNAEGRAGPAVAATEDENLSGFGCGYAGLERYCDRFLTTFDEMGFIIPPLSSAVDSCVINNSYGCHEAVVYFPDPDGWIQVRACNSIGESCSRWSGPKPVPEVDLDHGLALGILLIILAKALVGRWFHGEK